MPTRRPRVAHADRITVVHPEPGGHQAAASEGKISSAGVVEEGAAHQRPERPGRPRTYVRPGRVRPSSRAFSRRSPRLAQASASWMPMTCPSSTRVRPAGSWARRPQPCGKPRSPPPRSAARPPAPGLWSRSCTPRRLERGRLRSAGRPRQRRPSATLARPRDTCGELVPAEAFDLGRRERDERVTVGHQPTQQALCPRLVRHQRRHLRRTPACLLTLPRTGVPSVGDAAAGTSPVTSPLGSQGFPQPVGTAQALRRRPPFPRHPTPSPPPGAARRL